MTSNRAKAVSLLYTISFLLVISLPLLMGIVGIRTTDPIQFRAIELRDKHPFPKKIFPLEAVGNWFTDSYAFRSDLILLNAHLHSLLKVSSKPDDGVWGEDGWLFLGNNYDHTQAKHYGQYRENEMAFDRFFALRKRQAEILSRHNIPFLIIALPDKESIYPEKMRPQPIRDSNEIRLINERGEKVGLKVHEIRSALEEAKEEYGDLLYYKTDSHWTDLGAFIGYQAIIRIMNRVLSTPIEPVELYSFKSRLEEKEGDIRKVMHIPPGYTMDHEVALLFKPTTKQVHAQTIEGKEYTWSPFQKVHRKAKVIVVNDSAKSPLKVLFLRDSFTTALSPFLNNTFHESQYLHYKYKEARELEEYITRDKPDVVVLLQVERLLLSTTYLQ